MRRSQTAEIRIHYSNSRVNADDNYRGVAAEMSLYRATVLRLNF